MNISDLKIILKKINMSMSLKTRWL
jgi:hypothetical protein